MGNISGKLNLAAFTHAIRDGKNGEKILMLPINVNNLMLTEKGNVFLDIQGFPIALEKRNAERKDTHIVSQSLPKEKREALKAKDEYPPTLGNFINWSELSGGESAPNTAVNVGDIMPEISNEEDDLPF